MATYATRRWESDGSGMRRRDRRPCDYSLYFPDQLNAHDFTFNTAAIERIAAAERAISRLDAEAEALANTEALARLLLRAESVASSRIEGLEIGSRRLLRADAARASGAAPSDITANEILGNIDAMSWGIESISAGEPITTGSLLEIHRRLLAGTRMDAHAGKLRTVQNWIGGSSYNPCTAAFVPPPPEDLPRLLDDLCDFCMDDSLPAIAQAAIAHAQFETIHPFVDGNGRTGRTLIHLIFRRRELVTRTLPPVSLILATWAQEYVAGLTAFRYAGAPNSTAAFTAINQWITYFADACERAVEDALGFERNVTALQDQWRQRAGNPRRDSAIHLLIDRLPASPVLSADSAANLTGRSFQAATQAIARLEEAGVLKQINIGKRNRAFEAPELVDAFTAFERRLASPGGDTRFSAPARIVPPRPQIF